MKSEDAKGIKIGGNGARKALVKYIPTHPTHAVAARWRKVRAKAIIQRRTGVGSIEELEKTRSLESLLGR